MASSRFITVYIWTSDKLKIEKCHKRNTPLLFLRWCFQNCPHIKNTTTTKNAPCKKCRLKVSLWMGSLFIQYRLIFHSSSVWYVNIRAIPQLQFKFQIVSSSVQLPHVSTLVYSTISSTDLIYWANISNCRLLTTNTGIENSGRTVVVFGC